MPLEMPQELALLQELYAKLLPFALAGAIINYVITGIIYMIIAKKIAPDHVWMAWVPIVNSFCAAKYSDVWLNENKTGKLIRNFVFVFIFAFLSGVFLAAEIAVLALLFSLAMLVFSIMLLIVTIKSMFGLFKCFDSDNAVLYTVLSIFVPLAGTILLIVICTKNPVSTEPAQQFTPETNYVDRQNAFFNRNDNDDLKR